MQDVLPPHTNPTRPGAYADFDEAYVALVRRFYSHGHIGFSLAIANVAPKRTTVHLDGRVIRVLKGTTLAAGDDFTWIETWHEEGRFPYPIEHPVRYFNDEYSETADPAILAIRNSGGTSRVTVGRADALDPDLLTECYLQALHLLVREVEQKTGRAADRFVIASTRSPVMPNTRITPDEARVRARQVLESGLEVSLYVSWDYALCDFDVHDARREPVFTHPMGPHVDRASRPMSMAGKSTEQKLRWIERILGACQEFNRPPALTGVTWYDPMKGALTIRDVETFIADCVARGDTPMLSTIWHEGRTWMVAQPRPRASGAE